MEKVPFLLNTVQQYNNQNKGMETSDVAIHLQLLHQSEKRIYL